MVVVNFIKVVRVGVSPPQGFFLVCRQSRAALASRLREAGLDVDLLHTVLLLVELVVDLVEILHADTVSDHLQRVNLAFLDVLEQLLPVEVDGCLSVANQADTTLHQRANVEVVGLG